MKKVSNHCDIVIVVFLIMLAYLFPLTGMDYFWKQIEIQSVEQFFEICAPNLLPNLFALTATKFLIIKLLIYGVLFFILFSTIRNIANKKNYSLATLTAFLFLLLNKNIFAADIVNTTNFTLNILSTIALLYFYDLFTSNKILKFKPLFLLLVGFFSTVISPVVTFIILGTTLFYLRKNKIEASPRRNLLLLGEIVGTALTAFNTNIEYTGFMHNFFYSTIPVLQRSTILITIILSLLTIIEAIKSIRKNIKPSTVLSILSIISFVIISFINVEPAIYYVAFLIYLTSVYSILMNTKRRTLFKSRITYWIVFKLIYIFLVTVLGMNMETYILFLVSIDILIITLMYDHLLPRNYLHIVWTLISIILIISDMYIYIVTDNRYKEMNENIKLKIESDEEYVLPEKYKTQYLYDYIPTTPEYQRLFIEYFYVDPHIPNKLYTIRFKH